MSELNEFLSTIRTAVDAELETLVPAADVEPVRLHEAIRWSLFGGAKRFRPAVLIAAGLAFDATSKRLMRSAAAVEMIHTFSLIHDDLPAMDDDDLRRGRETCHKKFGEATAILAGDVLQTLAFKALAEDEGLSAETRIRIISRVAEASGTPIGMVAGQQLDLEAEGKSISIDQLETIHSRKTGALIVASAGVGALIGGASETSISSIELFALKLGLLFQITDDLLDVTQTTDTLGKTAGKDVKAEKATYPSTFGIDRTREMAFTVRDEACQILSRIDADVSLLSSMADHVLDRRS